jgi:hypothetical protein
MPHVAKSLTWTCKRVQIYIYIMYRCGGIYLAGIAHMMLRRTFERKSERNKDVPYKRRDSEP